MWSRLRRPRRVLLRRILYPAIESVWAAGFAVAGRLAPAHPAKWTAIGGARVGILAPHPDDETGSCGGVACLHRAAGDTVAVLILTDGGASRAGGLDREAMIACRAAEAQAAAAVLGITRLTQAGLPEGRWPFAVGVAAVARWLVAERPALVYAPSCVDYHPEHQRVAQVLAAALQGIAAYDRHRVRIYEAFVPLGPGLVNCVAGIGPVRQVKARALACYASQAAGVTQIRRRDRYLARYCGLAHAAEAYCDLSAEAYIALVAAGRWEGRVGPFRGLGPRPIADPLAYLAGARRRRALQSIVHRPSSIVPVTAHR